MTENILDERIDTGYRDLAGNIIYVGSTLSNPSHERAFDVYLGTVQIDDDGILYIHYQSKKNKNGVGYQKLTTAVAKNVLVIT